jgi:serine O-acetyltransferase
MRKALQLFAGDLRQKARWVYKSEGRGALLKAAVTDGTSAMLLYRLMQEAHAGGHGWAAEVISRLNGLVGRCHIRPGAEMGEAFVIVHSIGVVIGEGVRGGSKVHLHHLVTVEGGAEIGDGVIVGAGARILADARVGAGARVGANAVVSGEVAADVTVVGNPAREVVRRPR